MSTAFSTFGTGDLLYYNGSKWKPTGVINLPSQTNSSPSNGQIWYDSSSNTFKFYQNGSTSTLSGSSFALSSLSDVNLTEGSGINGFYLSWNNSSNAWKAKAMSLGNLSGVSLGTLTSNQVLQCVSGNFVNQVLNLTQLGDILVSSPSTGQILQYNNKWQNVSKLTLPSFTNGTLVNGDIWYDNSSSSFKFYQNSSTVSLSTFNPTLSSITTGNVIIYNGSNWVNAYLTLGNISGISMGTLANNQVLQYNGSNFVNQTLASTQLSDFTISSPSNHQILSYNAGKWINSNLITPTLSGDSDVSITSPSNGQVLMYNNSSSLWQNQTLVNNYVFQIIYLSGNMSYDSTNTCYYYNINTSINACYICDASITSVAELRISNSSLTTGWSCFVQFRGNNNGNWRVRDITGGYNNSNNLYIFTALAVSHQGQMLTSNPPSTPTINLNSTYMLTYNLANSGTNVYCTSGYAGFNLNTWACIDQATDGYYNKFVQLPQANMYLFWTTNMSSNINTTYNVQLMLPSYSSTGLQTRFKDAGGVQNSAVTTISANLTGSNSMFYGSGNLTLNTQNASNDYVIVNNPSGTTVYMLVLTR